MPPPDAVALFPGNAGFTFTKEVETGWNVRDQHGNWYVLIEIEQEGATRTTEVSNSILSLTYAHTILEAPLDTPPVSIEIMSTATNDVDWLI